MLCIYLKKYKHTHTYIYSKPQVTSLPNRSIDTATRATSFWAQLQGIRMRRLTTTRRCWVLGKATPAIWILTKTVGYGSKPTLIIAYLGMNIHKSKLFGGPTEGYQGFDLFWSRAIWFKKLNLASQKNQTPSDGFWSSLGTQFMVCTALWYILLGGWWFPTSLQPSWLPERSCRSLWVGW